MRYGIELHARVDDVLIGVDSKNTVRQDVEARDEGQVPRHGEDANQG
jgi:hypothetical protein